MTQPPGRNDVSTSSLNEDQLQGVLTAADADLNLNLRRALDVDQGLAAIFESTDSEITAADETDGLWLRHRS